MTGIWKSKLNKTVARLTVLLLAMSLLTGCSRVRSLLGMDDKVPEAFDADTVFTVDDRKVSTAEWDLYALAEEARINSLYGSGIWDIRINDELGTIADSMKKDIYEKIIYIKIVAGAADSLGVTLSEDDELDIDYLTDDYMEKLADAGRSTPGITKKLVSEVYRDNLLAERVSEKIMLNVNSDIEDDEVRHMVLDYVVVLKTYEDEKGDIVAYTDEELQTVAAGIEAYYDQVSKEIYGIEDKEDASDGSEDAQNSAGEAASESTAASGSDKYVKALSELHTETYVPTTFVADYSDLHDRLPYAIADTAYSMKEGELLGVIETDEAYYILFCESEEDAAATNAARIEVIERRQKDLFEEQYRSWEKKAVIRMNYDIWDAIVVR